MMVSSSVSSKEDRSNSNDREEIEVRPPRKLKNSKVEPPLPVTEWKFVPSERLTERAISAITTSSIT